SVVGRRLDTTDVVARLAGALQLRLQALGHVAVARHDLPDAVRHALLDAADLGSHRGGVRAGRAVALSLLPEARVFLPQRLECFVEAAVDADAVAQSGARHLAPASVAGDEDAG